MLDICFPVNIFIGRGRTSAREMKEEVDVLFSGGSLADRRSGGRFLRTGRTVLKDHLKTTS